MSSEAKIFEGLDAAEIVKMNETFIAVDDEDNVIGPKSKKDCHLMVNIERGLVHRGFSVLLFNSKNEFLLSQRSDDKILFPGFYSNTCCGHPFHTTFEMDPNGAIGIKRAAQRRLKQELGIEPDQVPLRDIHYVKRMSYKASFSDVWGEAEVVYLLVIQRNVDCNLNSNEVKAVKYFGKNQFKEFLNKEQNSNITPWFRIMLDHFLFDWWDHLDNLSKFKNHNDIVPLQ